MWKMFEGRDRFNNALYYVCDEEKQKCIAQSYYGIHGAKAAVREVNGKKNCTAAVMDMPQGLVPSSVKKIFL